MSDVPPSQPPSDPDPSQQPPSGPPQDTVSYPRGGGSGSGPGGAGQYDIGVIGRAWPLVQAQLSNWIVVTLVYIVIFMAAGFTLNIGFRGVTRGLPTPMLISMGIPFSFARSGVLYMIHGILSAGMFTCAFKQLRGETFSVNDLFSFGGNIGSILTAGLLMGLLQGIAMCFCCLPFFVVAGGLMFTMPLIVDRGMQAGAAMTLSFDTAKPQLAMASVAFFVIWFVGAIGVVACGFGLLITVPVMIMSIAMLYRDFFPAQA